jgi:hypothetical protein
MSSFTETEYGERERLDRFAGQAMAAILAREAVRLHGPFTDEDAVALGELSYRIARGMISAGKADAQRAANRPSNPVEALSALPTGIDPTDR